MHRSVWGGTQTGCRIDRFTHAADGRHCADRSHRAVALEEQIGECLANVELPTDWRQKVLALLNQQDIEMAKQEAERTELAG